MSKYEISQIRSIDDEIRFVIYSKEEHAFFAGYDFMGSVDWEYSSVPSAACELTAEDDPEQIVKDLEAADDVPECTVVYGLSRNIKHEVIMPVSEAFRRLSELKTGWLFLNIFYQGRLVYTTQGAAGYRFRCKDCPYPVSDKTVTRKQYNAIYGG